MERHHLLRSFDSEPHAINPAHPVKIFLHPFPKPLGYFPVPEQFFSLFADQSIQFCAYCNVFTCFLIHLNVLAKQMLVLFYESESHEIGHIIQAHLYSTFSRKPLTYLALWMTGAIYFDHQTGHLIETTLS